MDNTVLQHEFLSTFWSSVKLAYDHGSTTTLFEWVNSATKTR